MRRTRLGRLPRLADYDYRRPGFYFITICTWRRRALPARVDRRGLFLTPEGRVVREEWLRGFRLRPGAFSETFVVMPDHFHALLRFDETVLRCAPPVTGRCPGLPCRQPRSLSALVACFKASSTRRINEIRGLPGAPVWQSRFHDRVVRGPEELERIRAYIEQNPSRLLFGRN